MRHFRREQEGGYIVLITVLILGVAATTVAMFLLITGTDASLTSLGVESGTQAKAAAEACTNLALKEIQQDIALTTPASGSSTLDSTTGQECSYQITGSTPDFTIASIGTVRQTSDNYIQRINVTLDQVTPNLHISNWQEAP